MRTVWLAWVLLLAAQLSNEAVGQLDLPSLYTGEPFYGERAVFVLACAAFSLFIWRQRPDDESLRLASFGALTVLAGALVLAPINDRHFYVPAMAIAQLLMAVQVWIWSFRMPRTAMSGPDWVWTHEMDDNRAARLGARIVAGMQSLALILFCYAQLSIGIEPAPPGAPGGAIYYLHGPAADLMPALIGTLLLLWASRRA